MRDTRSQQANDASDICVRLGPYEVQAATGFGPRITGLRLLDGPQIFAKLSPEVGIDSPGVGVYVFHGGHRLWVSPEIPWRTHLPDNRPCEVEHGSDSLLVLGPRDEAGFEKKIELVWRGDQLTIDHLLRWAGNGPIRVASWAITQMPLGGVGILPVTGTHDSPPFQADSSLVLWPYTRLDDPRVTWQRRAVLVRAEPGTQLKLGSSPAPRGLGYLRHGYLFTKRFHSVPSAAQPDMGAVGQVYVNENFLELESVGPIDQLEPGEEIGHREIWEVTECVDLDSAVKATLEES